MSKIASMFENNFNRNNLIIFSLVSLFAIILISMYFIIQNENIVESNNVDDYQDISVGEILNYNFKNHDVEMLNLSPIFRIFFTSQDADLFVNHNSMNVFDGGKLLFADKLSPTYQKLKSDGDAVVIFPIFTAAAYSEPGFYTYFRGECDESCITDVSFDNPQAKYSSSIMGTQMLYDLGYDFVTDIDVDKNPEILKNYETVILLHNEYVTQKMFDAVVSHPKIIYLYPNALYAEITVDYTDNTMTLIRGHNYPEFEIKNGFNYEVEERFHDYEYDTECLNWEFFQFENGWALNCYPDNVIFADLGIIHTVKLLP